MRIQTIQSIDQNNGWYALLTYTDKVTTDSVGRFKEVLTRYRQVLKQCEDHPQPSSDTSHTIPIIVEVLDYVPPKKVVPQLKHPEKAPFEQPKGWFKHPNPAKQSSGVVLEWDPGEAPSYVGLTPDRVCCISCGFEVESTINTIRARIFETLIRTEKELDQVDPTTGEPVKSYQMIPRYATGRLCKGCQNKLNGISGRPPKRGEFEYLNERIKPRKRRVVTAGAAEGERISNRIQKERESVRYEDLGDLLVREPDPIPEPIDGRSYNTVLGLNRRKPKGARTDYLVDYGERNR